MSSTVGIYVSIPFCRAKCSYCNFASSVFGDERMAAYVGKLVQEIRDTRRKSQEWSAILPASVDTVYFGGGTPSLLSPEQLRPILQALHEEFAFSPDGEITLECAPGQLQDSLLHALPELGFNRVSLGVQSFVDREAAAVGRMHTRVVAIDEIARLRSVGIQDINIDLIAGLPHQTPESWRTSLDQAIATEVPHLSVYMLDVDEDSRLGRELLAGGSRYHVGQVPDDEAIATMYNLACEQFNGAGIKQYEISNFAHSGYESRHNLKYWTRQPYIGFGLDAHSFLESHDGNAARIATTDDLPTFLNRSAPEIVTPVSQVTAVEEAWFLGLRLSAGVSLTELEYQFGRTTMDAFLPVLLECEQENFIERRCNRVRLTTHGRLFANEVFERFIGVVSSVDAIEVGTVSA